MAKGDAQMAYDEAMKAKNISENARVDLETLLNNIRDFLQQDGATPSDIEAVRLISSHLFILEYVKNIRIYHYCVGGIVKSVLRITVWNHNSATQPCSAVSSESDYRSGSREFDPGMVPYFHGD